MAHGSSSQSERLAPAQQLELAREVLRAEGQALLQLAERLDTSLCGAVTRILQCPGNVIVTGMGKAGLVGQKVAATLASTGTCSHFVHPAEAVHGDLGRVERRDLVLALSFSGETEELVRLLPCFREQGIPVIAITGNRASTLAASACEVLDVGRLSEACPLGLAPSTSTTAMLALGDALALVLSRLRRFTPEDFARFHPGGSLGRKLSKVDELMRPREACRVAAQQLTVREVIVQVSRPGRRTGAIMLVDARDRLTGVFTDSDLARILEEKEDAALDLPMAEVMTRGPMTVPAGTPLVRAVELLAARKISELPVVDARGVPVGIIDITDVVGCDALEGAPAEPARPPARVVQPFPHRRSA